MVLRTLQGASVTRIPRVKPAKQVLRLRKLPGWGRQNPGDTIFEWPTKEILDRMPLEVTLKSLEFCTYKPDDHMISSVRCILSNNEVSPVFIKADDLQQYRHKVINFDACSRVQKVQAIGCKYGVFRVTFLDNKSDEIDSYNPRNRAREGTVHEIKDNEELIGVYGVKDKDQYFTKFGFIVRVRQL